MEMLGGLVLPQVGVNATGSESVHEVPGDRFGCSHQLQKQLVVGLFQGKKGFYVPLGEQDDMVFPERVSVVKGENMFILEVHRHIQQASQNLLAIKITNKNGHISPSIPAQPSAACFSA